MEFTNLEQALTLQKEFKDRLIQGAQVLDKGKSPPLETVLTDTGQLIAQAQARLDGAVKERAAILQQWDERIARLKEQIQQLQAAVANVKKQAAEESKAADAVAKKNAEKKKPK